MLKKIIKKLKQQDKYVEWTDYKNRIDFLDTFAWQQSVRKQSIKNLKLFS